MLWNVVICVVAILPLNGLSVFVHELGHAALGRCAGAIITSFGLGWKNPAWVGRIGETKVYLCPFHWWLSLTFWIFPSFHVARWRMVLSLAGGTLANVWLGVLAVGLWGLIPGWWPICLPLAAINALLVVGNLLPFTIGPGAMRLPNDASLILSTLAYGSPTFCWSATLRALRGLGELWRAVGDYRTLGLYLRHVASCWAQLGDLQEAGRLLAEADALPEPRERFLRASNALMRGLTLPCLGRPGEAAVALATADRLYAELGLQDGRDLVSLGEEALVVRRVDTDGAWDRLQTLAERNAFVNAPSLRPELVAARAVAAASRGYVELAEYFTNEFFNMTKTKPSALTGFLMLRAVARRLWQREELAKSVHYYGQALRALQTLHSSFAREDRARLYKSQAPLFDEVLSCCQRLGNEKMSQEIERELAKLANAEVVGRRGPPPAFSRRASVLIIVGLVSLILVFLTIVAIAGLDLLSSLWP